MVDSGEELPHVSLERSLGTTKEIVNAVQLLQRQQEDADKKASKEIRSHAQTKEKIKSVELDALKAREIMENEAREHRETKDRLDKAEREHNNTRDLLLSQKQEVSSMMFQMEALKVEMEAQRKAFVVNVNWAAKCTELKVKFDESRVSYEKLSQQHIETKAALEAADKAREDYKGRSQDIQQALEETRAEMARLTEELSGKTQMSDEIQAKLAEWQAFKSAQAAEAISYKGGRSKAMGVLQRQLNQGALGLMMSTFNAWSALTTDEKKMRLQKDQATKRAMKLMADQGLGLLIQCFGPWKQDTARVKKAALEAAARKLEDANSRTGGSAEIARKRALEQLEKQFIGQDKALTKQSFQAWASGKAMRAKKDKNLQKGARMIANSAKAVTAEIFLIWNGLTEKTRLKKKQKEASSQKALRMIANSDKAIVAEIMQILVNWLEDIRAQRKKKEAGTAKAMRMMSNSDTSLMNLCCDSWAKVLGEKKKKDEGNKKALRMIANSSEAMLKAVVSEWMKMYVTKKCKDASTAKAVRMIAASGEALQAACFKSWSDYILKNREKNKKLRAVEKTIGASADGLKLLVFTAWHTTGLQDGRKKRAKERAMSSSMKSINGDRDILYVFIYGTWARLAVREKLLRLQSGVDTKQAELDEAIAVATKAVEDDVGKAMEEVERLKEELEKARKELAQAQAKAEEMDVQLQEAAEVVRGRETQLGKLDSELEESRRKARDIGEELAKVGIFLQNSGNRKPARPRSGTKSGEGKLPNIGKVPSRPSSGRSGGKSGAPVPPTSTTPNAKQAWSEDGQL
eukprot:CAMPEP_0169085446 /NCGR_PEP_ID=MMETSP1015-20121227/13164_1 /TAXON_ID=342587 /ORGANISM="Karlodinium micrum, Strain CCMP2283" /LENGTH=802 /DNA_ID=CAMNT_0009145533 /DNA_START=87 /DNA_END=2495 /DNA_ORIENTATION=+